MSVAFSKPMKIEHNDTNEILMTVELNTNNSNILFI
jgi:hypothetical protein